MGVDDRQHAPFHYGLHEALPWALRFFMLDKYAELPCPFGFFELGIVKKQSCIFAQLSDVISKHIVVHSLI
jgi:hypothetical protein